jgi:membrane-associated phospholipid phosphatase
VFILTVGLCQSKAHGAFWEQLTAAAQKAVTQQETWLPAALAGAIALSGTDEKISVWASDNTPVFGSQKNASQWSDYLAASAAASGLVTVAMVPDKRTALAVDIVANGLTISTTELLKTATHRLRPDASAYNSFPSGHTSFAAANSYLAAQNLEHLTLPDAEKTSLSILFYGFAAGTGWARVEAKKHYVTDVLAGYALGCFISTLVNNFAADDKSYTKASILKEGFAVCYTIQF